MMNLQHWRLLVAVADTGNVSRGAESVGITQSGASQAIAQLEAALGIPVFARENRRLTVTALGEQVVAHARTMLAQLDAIRALADNSQGIGRARIRLGSFPSVLSTVLPPLMRDFQRRYPGIELVALEGTDEEVEHWLASGAIELGVVLNPEPARDAVVLGQDAWVAIVPTGHALGRRASEPGVALHELASEPFILATGSCSVHGQRLVEDAGLRLADVRVTVRDWASACALVREGMGVALVPESTLPETRQGLRVLRLNPPVYRSFGLVRAETANSSPAVQVLLDALAARRKGPASTSAAWLPAA